MERVICVKVEKMETTTRKFNQIRVVLGDLHLTCDLVADRQIRLAKRIADSHQASFMYDDANAERVREVLGIV